jgi:hypothetical protein
LDLAPQRFPEQTKHRKAFKSFLGLESPAAQIQHHERNTMPDMTPRDFIKVAAILAQRSKGAIVPVTRAEFIGQWEKALQNDAAAVWDEVKKESRTQGGSKAISEINNELARIGARHTGRIDRTETESFHFYTFNAYPVILRAFHTGTYEVYTTVEGNHAMDAVGICETLVDLVKE